MEFSGQLRFLFWPDPAGFRFSDSSQFFFSESYSPRNESNPIVFLLYIWSHSLFHQRCAELDYYFEMENCHSDRKQMHDQTLCVPDFRFVNIRE
jgi:hypothetical protein